MVQLTCNVTALPERRFDFYFSIWYPTSNVFRGHHDIFSISDIEKLKNWASILQETKKQQGFEVLFQDYKYCCLGILGECNLVSEEFQKYKESLTSFLASADFTSATNISTNDTETIQVFFSTLNDVFTLPFERIGNIVKELVDFIEVSTVNDVKTFSFDTKETEN